MSVARSRNLVISHWPAPNPLEAARLALRVGGLTDSLTYPVVSGTGIKGGKKLCERAVPAGFRVVDRRRCAAFASLPAKLPTQRRHHVLGGTVALEAGENDRILARDSGRARLGCDAGNRSAPDNRNLDGQLPVTPPLAARGRLRQSCSARDSIPPADWRDRVVSCPCGAGLIAPARSFGIPPRH
jgi:hypothetical protein